MSAVTLEEAKSIAKKKRLELIHIVNDKDKPVRTEKEVYKLMSRLESLTDDLEETEGEVADTSMRYFIICIVYSEFKMNCMCIYDLLRR